MAFDTSHIQNLPKGLDPEIVKQTHQGKGWGEQDQKRYDVAIGKRKTGKQVREMRQEGGWKDTHASLEEHQNQGGTLGGNAQKQFDRMDTRLEKRADAKERSQIFKGNQASSGEQNVNQSNDIDSTVTGDNNFVTNDQDNSVRYYGGNTTNFNYQSSGEGPDTPATMMTLAGIGKPQDSPADTARFIGKYSDMNRDLQKGYDNKAMNVANKYISRAAQTNPIDYEALDTQISQSIQNHYDQSTQQQALYQGDVFNYKTPEFKMPKPPSKIESNVGDIADDYKDDLDDD